jgi:hypothetical protein
MGVSKPHLLYGRDASRMRKEEDCVPACTSRWDALNNRVWLDLSNCNWRDL